MSTRRGRCLWWKVTARSTASMLRRWRKRLLRSPSLRLKSRSNRALPSKAGRIRITSRSTVIAEAVGEGRPLVVALLRVGRPIRPAAAPLRRLPIRAVVPRAAAKPRYGLRRRNNAARRSGAIETGRAAAILTPRLFLPRGRCERARLGLSTLR